MQLMQSSNHLRSVVVLQEPMLMRRLKLSNRPRSAAALREPKPSSQSLHPPNALVGHAPKLLP
jgi:hypothetical protein